ncbi:MAG: FGGY family carbohydrate kinase [Ilumatobacteraceae bacterium]
MIGPCTLAIDQGTTNTKVLAVDKAGTTVAAAAERIELTHPRSGWAESDPSSIWRSVATAIENCLSQIPETPITSIGVCNQRESVVMWQRSSGEPLGPLVSWQCTRGSALCDSIASAATRTMVAARTGLGLEPMFSASKMRWLLDSIPDGPARAAAGEICLGTVDSWLLWNLTGGRSFGTDHTNASRALLCNLVDLDWDLELLELFGIPRAALPSIQASASVHGQCISPGLGRQLEETTIGAVLGDSHAALVGHGAFETGSIKASFGTGTSVMAPSADVVASGALSSTVAWSRERDGISDVHYAIEGNIFATGAALEWTAKLLGLGTDVADLEELARTRDDAGGVVLVPAFAGLGAPHWDAHARGLIVGLTADASRAELARSSFECVAHQVAEVLDAAREVLGTAQRLTVHADGGATRSNLVTALVADLADVELLRSDDAEIAAIGAAHFAGLTAGLWAGLDELRDLPRHTTRIVPTMADADRSEARSRWAHAVDQASSGQDRHHGTP